MSKAIYIQKGDTIDFVNDTESLIESGEIVNLVARIAIAGCDVKPNEVGVLHLTGVYQMPKAENEAISFGSFVYLNSDEKITAKKSDTVNEKAIDNIFAGLAIEDAKANDSTIKVRIG